MKKPLIVIGVLVVLALVIWASLRDSGPRGTEVEVQAVELRTVSSRVKATGEITPETRVDISAKVVGELINLPVVEGQEIRNGQLLLEIESDLYEAARNQARAAVRQAEVSVRRQEVQLADARRNIRRTKELIADGLVSQEALDTAERVGRGELIEARDAGADRSGGLVHAKVALGEKVRRVRVELHEDTAGLVDLDGFTEGYLAVLDGHEFSSGDLSEQRSTQQQQGEQDNGRAREDTFHPGNLPSWREERRTLEQRRRARKDGEIGVAISACVS